MATGLEASSAALTHVMVTGAPGGPVAVAEEDHSQAKRGAAVPAAAGSAEAACAIENCRISAPSPSNNSSDDA